MYTFIHVKVILGLLTPKDEGNMILLTQQDGVTFQKTGIPSNTAGILHIAYRGQQTHSDGE
jgi:hypothetical protein